MNISVSVPTSNETINTLDRCHTCNFIARDFVAQLYRATKLHAVSHTVTLSHKQELTNQRSPHFRDKFAQNRALL